MGGGAMTAAAILARAEAAGLAVEADGDRLRLIAAARPADALLHELAGAKAELLALLEARAEEAADYAARQAEPLLPPVGTPERTRLDEAQRKMLAGLMAVAGRRTTLHTENQRDD